MKKLILGLAFAFILISQAEAVVILPPGATWEYTFTDPTGDSTWNTTTGVGGIWSSGPAPFGNSSGGDFGYNTYWPASGSYGDDLWVRTSVDFTGFELSTIKWDLGVDNGFKLYANGSLVSSDNAEGYTYRWEYSGDFSGVSLTPSSNIIAVALEDHGGLTAFDMQIKGDPIPEPATMLLLGSGLLGLAGLRRKFKK